MNYQIIITLDFCAVSQEWDSIKFVEDISRWVRSIVEEENNKSFQETVDGDFSSHNHSSLRVFVVVLSEVLRRVQNCSSLGRRI
jgi:hypothetical protein